MSRKARTTPTDSELAFLAEYQSNGWNATLAYMTVHPRANRVTARTQAAKVLAKPYIRARLARMHAAAERESGVEAGRVLREWAALAFSDLGHVIDFEALTLRTRIPPAARRAIAQVRVRRHRTPAGHTSETVDVRLHSKAEALDRLSRHLGLYKDLPPLETVIALLPPALAEVLRAELARAVPPGGGGGGPRPGGGPDAGRPPVGADGDGGEGDHRHPGEPVDPVLGDAVEAGPLAAGVPGGDGPADAPPLLPPGGEVGDERGEDAGPLFDDP